MWNKIYYYFATIKIIIIQFVEIIEYLNIVNGKLIKMPILFFPYMILSLQEQLDTAMDLDGILKSFMYELFYNVLYLNKVQI